MPDSRIDALFSEIRTARLSRRAALKRATALGLSAPVIAGILAACGGDDESTATSQPDATSQPAGQESTATPASASTAAPDEPTGTTATDASAEPSATETLSADATTTPEVTRGGDGLLRVLWWQAPTTLNGHLSVAGKDIGAIHICMEPLAYFNSDGSMTPVLAAEIPSTENGGVAEDLSSVTWKLREGVKWHDGEDFTADDVAFTYQFLSDPATNATTMGFYRDIESIDVIDDYTVQINFASPVAAWFNPFVGNSGTILPEHVLADWVGEDAVHAPFNLEPVGTGPFRVTEFRPGDVVVYQAFADYWDPGKPHFDEVELKGGGDATGAARAVLQTGEADWAWNLQVEARLLEQMEESGDGVLVNWPGAGTEKLLLNHSDPETELDGQRSHRDVPHPHFQDLRVRQAIALAIPRDVIAQELYGPAGQATGYTMNESPEYMPPGISWEYDIERANALLDEAGAARGSDGIRELNGRPMRWVSSATINSVRQKTQEIMKQSFGELGIEMEIRAVEASAYFDASNDASFQKLYYDFGTERNAAQIYPLQWYVRYLSADPLVDIAQAENGWAGRNHQRYQNEEFNALYEAARSEVDKDTYVQIFHEMQQHVVDNVADIGVVSSNNVSAAAGDLTGYNPSSFVTELQGIKDWRRS